MGRDFDCVAIKRVVLLVKSLRSDFLWVCDLCLFPPQLPPFWLPGPCRWVGDSQAAADLQGRLRVDWWARTGAGWLVHCSPSTKRAMEDSFAFPWIHWSGQP